MVGDAPRPPPPPPPPPSEKLFRYSILPNMYHFYSRRNAAHMQHCGRHIRNARSPPPLAERTVASDSVAKTSATIEARAIAPAIVKSHEARVSVARTVVTAWIGVRAGIPG